MFLFTAKKLLSAKQNCYHLHPFPFYIFYSYIYMGTLSQSEGLLASHVYKQKGPISVADQHFAGGRLQQELAQSPQPCHGAAESLLPSCESFADKLSAHIL